MTESVVIDVCGLYVAVAVMIIKSEKVRVSAYEYERAGSR